MTVLTDNDYQRLTPYLADIRKYRQIGQWVGKAAHPVIAEIIRQRTGEIMNLSCGGCIARMYDLINLYLDQYEQSRG